MMREHGLHPNSAVLDRRLLSVGSVMQFAGDGDVIWGSGINGKLPLTDLTFTSLDVRAVRGQLTRAILLKRGIHCPAVFGDPALLLPRLEPRLVGLAQHKRHALTVAPNLHDFPRFSSHPDVLNPMASVRSCLARIARSEFVVGSSLHGIIVAESLGIPARAFVSAVESPFKYHDYYSGTNRHDIEIATDSDTAREMGGAPAGDWDPQPLVDAFPTDLWRPAA
ncbi:polysaccharide pyruvyl transferase family protein [uncultured Jatrophihabitans sp.]|uniref:polysaccharide pyruvyl transferase family protein n=1 Tax=uncultured Jatrophihabitans sp. TaxID=1610747 RepID=UPI0035CA569D